jgi:hypothetical protein
MDPSLSLHIASCIWMTAGVAGVIGALRLSLRNDNNGWWKVTIALGMAVGASGLITLAVAMAGWPSGALYFWRATALICFLIGPTILIRMVTVKKQEAPASTGGQGGSPGNEVKVARIGPLLWSTLIGTGITAAIAWLSFQSYSLPVDGDAITSSARVGVTSTLPVESIVWIVTLIAVGFGTVHFLILFLQLLQEGDTPQIESHWGGIGGGLGGWRMSRSLGYLLVAAALTVLFTVFLLRFPAPEGSKQDGGKPSATPIPSATPETGGAPRKETAPDSGDKKSPH